MSTFMSLHTNLNYAPLQVNQDFFFEKHVLQPHYIYFTHLSPMGLEPMTFRSTSDVQVNEQRSGQ